MRFPLTRIVGLFALALVGFSPGPSSMQTGDELQRGEWRAYAGTTRGMKYSPLDQITKGNIQDLRIVWQSPSPELELQKSSPVTRSSRNENTPLMANGVLYTVTGLGVIAAIDPGTGQTRWVYNPESYKLGRPNNGGFMTRTFGYWTDGTIERLLVGTHDAYLLSIDARTGKLDPAFGSGGRIDLTAGIRDANRSLNYSARDALVAGDIVVAGASISDSFRDYRQQPPGYVKAFDVRTGRLLWTFHTIPRPGEFGHDTWLADSAEYMGNTNSWATMAYDPELDYVYFATSTPSSDHYGARRPGNNLFAESLVCVEAKTGKRVWHFQAVHHGLWDYDFAAQPVLGDITVNGRRIQAVMQVSKQAFTYVFDRKTGEPVWPIEERPAPKGDAPDEWYAPTQPFPTKPPAFDLQGTTEDNLIDFTPQLKNRARVELQKYVHGPLFTPPSEKGTLALPSVLGASGWGGASFDPETGVLYVPSRTTPSQMKLTPVDPKVSNARYLLGGGALYLPGFYFDGLPLFKPPYTRVTAIDMNRGEHMWVRPLGNGPRDHPLLKDLNLPALGDISEGQSALVTKTLLFVSVWRRQRDGRVPLVPPWSPYGDPDFAKKILYVFDKQSGDLLREIELPGQAAASPLTYLYRGKQYLAMAVGGNEDAAIVALALPDKPGR
jgi:quinoprotein glucose dehydrogenase